MCLADGGIGNSYIVNGICLEEAAKRRLEVLGMVQGTSVQILSRKRGGAMIIKVRGARFAIGMDFAKGIVVEN